MLAVGDIPYKKIGCTHRQNYQNEVDYQLETDKRMFLSYNSTSPDLTQFFDKLNSVF